MTFKKIWVQELAHKGFLVRTSETKGWDIYFTDDTGIKKLSQLNPAEPLNFQQLPKPLLKQIK